MHDTALLHTEKFSERTVQSLNFKRFLSPKIRAMFDQDQLSDVFVDHQEKAFFWEQNWSAAVCGQQDCIHVNVIN